MLAQCGVEATPAGEGECPVGQAGAGVRSGPLSKGLQQLELGQGCLNPGLSP